MSESNTTHAHDDAGGAAGGSQHHEDHGGVGKYLAVFGGLCVLTLISFGVANFEPIMRNPGVGWTIMMAVSCAKAMLVISFFMHLLWEANWKYVLTIPASIMSILLVLLLVPDIGLRTRHYSAERERFSAVPRIEPREGDLAVPLGANPEAEQQGES